MSDKEQIEKLKADLDRLHRERDSFQQQARVLAEEVERLIGLFWLALIMLLVNVPRLFKHWWVICSAWQIIDYAIWQAITDVESRCRHRPTGLQIEIEDREHEPVSAVALEILVECGAAVVENDKFPNIKINYDKNKNVFESPDSLFFWSGHEQVWQ